MNAQEICKKLGIEHLRECKQLPYLLDCPPDCRTCPKLQCIDNCPACAVEKAYPEIRNDYTARLIGVRRAVQERLERTLREKPKCNTITALRAKLNGIQKAIAVIDRDRYES